MLIKCHTASEALLHVSPHLTGPTTPRRILFSIFRYLNIISRNRQDIYTNK